MKKLINQFRLSLFRISIIPLVAYTLSSMYLVFDVQRNNVYRWLSIKNETYIGTFERYYSERRHDIASLSSTPLLTHLKKGDSISTEGSNYLNNLMKHYDYSASFIFDSEEGIIAEHYRSSNYRERIFKTLIYDYFDDEALGVNDESVHFDYVRHNNDLFGYMIKKIPNEHGRDISVILLLNNIHISNIIDGVGVYDNNIRSYLFKQSEDGGYFISDFYSEAGYYGFGTKPDHVPIYWYLSKQNDNVFGNYLNAKDIDSFVSVKKFTILGQDLFIASFLPKMTIYSTIFEFIKVLTPLSLVLIVYILYISSTLSNKLNVMVNNIRNVTLNIAKGNLKVNLPNSNFLEVNNIYQSYQKLIDALRQTRDEQLQELRLEKELKHAEDLYQFSHHLYRIFSDYCGLDNAFFYLKKESEQNFNLISQYLSLAPQAIKQEGGVINYSFDMDKVVVIESCSTKNVEFLEQYKVTLGHFDVIPKYYVGIPLIPRSDQSLSAYFMFSTSTKPTLRQKTFIEHSRKQIALLMSYVLQAQQIKKLLVQKEQKEQELMLANKQLTQVSRVDSLTGLYNRYYGEMLSDQALDNANRNSQVLSLLIFDVDHFKKYNDHYGHIKGDKCLQDVAQAVSKIQWRQGDFIYRFGGEEFIVVLPNTSQQGAMAVAEKIQSAIKGIAIKHEKSDVSDIVTASIGGYTLRKNFGQVSMAEIVSYADEALYRAKEKRDSFVIL